jgi:hypothetical protein
MSDAPLADAGPPALTLRAVTVGPVGLPFGTATAIEVELTDAGGAVQPGELVTFALEGSAADSSLGYLEATTDARGRASVRLQAGERPASFRVRANHALASPVWIDVTVAASFGRLVARPTYGGSRTIERWTLTLFSTGDCTAALAAPDTGLSRVISAATGEARFDALPTDGSYTVLARASVSGDTSDRVTATGCVMGVGVLADADTVVEVVATSAPLDLGGAYEVTLALDTRAGAAAPLDDVVAMAGARVGDATDDANRMFDALGDELAGNSAGLAALARLRSSAGPTVLAGLLILDGSAPSADLGALLGRVIDALADLRVEGTLEFAVGDVPNLALRRLVADGMGTTPLVFAAPFSGDVVVAATFLGDTDVLALERLSIPLPLGQALAAVLEAQRTAAGLDSTGELLGSDACSSLRTYVETDAPLAGACDASCTARACSAGLDATLAAAIGDPASLDASRERLELSGNLEVRDLDLDLRADTLHGPLTGTFRSADGSAEGPVTGELSAARPLG